MFDYARNMKLALADTARRTAFKAAAGVVIAVGAGFLLAALWSFLATDLGWGSTMASLAVGGGFVVIGVIVMLVAGKVRHQPPTTDDLKAEVEARISLAADAAMNRAQSEAARFADMAENRVHSLIDRASYQASKVVGDAERSAYGFARNTARSVGLTAENLNTAQEKVDEARRMARDAGHKVSEAANTNAGSMAKLVGALAVGVALASKVQDWRRSDQDVDPEWYDDPYDDRRY
ncbi:MAG: phage holin family protein [Paracoccus sp. (in: a-proteobacteria)]|uniref:phage holin family protein n=1 Tax=Paracoccus sp. TaxID=267 RepID=UPI0026DF3321|nr:phage holin family protein [Paracoccus sp. (in: a-proteobacteria)]MDO5614103.1 phage holin family protein [Paracoccus sp. (in: a-proteobacteria)]